MRSRCLNKFSGWHECEGGTASLILPLLACIARTVWPGVDGVFRNGAPWPMKMGTIRSLWRYDVVRGDATDSEALRQCFRQQPPHDFRVTFDC